MTWTHRKTQPCPSTAVWGGIVADGRGATWHGYTPDTPEAQARELFRARFGRDPETVWRVPGAILAGPV